jgi:hypothetical protein
MTEGQMKAEIGKIKNRLYAQKLVNREILRRVDMLTEDVKTLTTALIEQTTEKQDMTNQPTHNEVNATLKLINERMDYLSNEVVDRSYDQLMELNELGDMREYLKGLAA